MAEDWCDCVRIPKEVEEHGPAASAMLPSMIRRYSAARKKMTRAQKLKNRCAPVPEAPRPSPRGADALSDKNARRPRLSSSARRIRPSDASLEPIRAPSLTPTRPFPRSRDPRRSQLLFIAACVTAATVCLYGGDTGDAFPSFASSSAPRAPRRELLAAGGSSCGETPDWEKNGGIVGYFVGVFFMFLGIAIVCDDFFVACSRRSARFATVRRRRARRHGGGVLRPELARRRCPSSTPTLAARLAWAPSWAPPSSTS